MNRNIFSYNNTPITFLRGDRVMINATEMARPFGKTPKDWLRTEQAKSFIASLSAVRQISLTEIVKKQQGGIPKEQGTWLHEDAAMEFARWLSPTFAIWCNDRIKELLTQGVTIIDDDDKTILRALEVLQKRVAEKRRQAQEAFGIIAKQEGQIKALKKESEYLNTILSSKETVTVSQIAQDYGCSARSFNKILQKMRIQRRVNDQWVLYAQYIGKGYVQSRTIWFYGRGGHQYAKMVTDWTQKGRLFLFNVLREAGILPLIER